MVAVFSAITQTFLSIFDRKTNVDYRLSTQKTQTIYTYIYKQFIYIHIHKGKLNITALANKRSSSSIINVVAGLSPLVSSLLLSFFFTHRNEFFILFFLFFLFSFF